MTSPQMFVIAMMLSLAQLALGTPIIDGRAMFGHLSDQEAGFSLGARIAFLTISIAGLLVLTACVIHRIRYIGYFTKSKREPVRQASLIRYLVFAIYADSACFILAAIILQYGFGLNSSTHCKGAIMLCLVFWLGAKLLMYTFFTERARVLNVPVVDRKRDLLWKLNMGLIYIGFGIIAVLAFVYLVADINSQNDNCRVGVKTGVLSALLTYDVFISLWLTGLFINLANRHMNGIVPKSVSDLWRKIRGKPRGRPDSPFACSAIDSRGDLSRLSRKTLIGCSMMLSSTIVNMSVLLKYRGHEPGWLCLLICTLDVLIGVTCIHWITTGRAANIKSKGSMRLRGNRPTPGQRRQSQFSPPASFSSQLNILARPAEVHDAQDGGSVTEKTTNDASSNGSVKESVKSAEGSSNRF